MKTAISIPDPIFNAVDLLSKREKISRSEVFVTAVKEFLQRRKNKQLLEQLNHFYRNETEAEKEALKKIRSYQSHHIQKHNSW